MKHAIIPTDLSIRSLQPVHDVIRYFDGDKVRITMLHLLNIPGGIADLLVRLHRSERHYPLPKAYLSACEVMTNRYSSGLQSIRTSIERGSTKAYLSNLLEGLKADAVFMPANTRFESPFYESVNILPLLRASGCKVVETASYPALADQVDASIGALLLAGG